MSSCLTNCGVVFGDGTCQTSAAGSPPNVCVFCATGSWTMPTGTKFVEVYLVGGGGAGSGTAVGGAGGSGFRTIIPAECISSPVCVVVGAGGVRGVSDGGGRSIFCGGCMATYVASGGWCTTCACMPEYTPGPCQGIMRMDPTCNPGGYCFAFSDKYNCYSQSCGCCCIVPGSASIFMGGHFWRTNSIYGGGSGHPNTPWNPCICGRSVFAGRGGVGANGCFPGGGGSYLYNGAGGMISIYSW